MGKILYAIIWWNAFIPDKADTFMREGRIVANLKGTRCLVF